MFDRVLDTLLILTSQGICTIKFSKRRSECCERKQKRNEFDERNAGTWVRVLVVIKRLIWRTFIRSHSKNKPSFLYTPFWTIFLVKKRHHRNKNLDLLMLHLYTTSKHLYTTSKHFFPFFTTKRNKQINLRQKYFHSYNTYTSSW